jgi:hypothetical protein
MGDLLKNVGLQHEVLPHYKKLYLIATRGAKYGKANMTCRLYAKSCEVGMGIHKHYSTRIPSFSNWEFW